MKKLDDLSSNLIYEIQKAFYDERGKGARYRLVRVGVEYVEKELGDKAKSVDSLVKGLKELGFVEDITYNEEDIIFSVETKNCVFRTVRDLFMDKGLQPLSCPVANIVMNFLESKTGLSPELMPIERDNGTCRFSLAKMATSDVVED